MPARATHRAAADSVLTGRVRAAGAVILGKTNVPPMAGDWQANNPVFGRTNNPWDLSRTPGGSTGGGAAALAAGLTALEFGSDIGGSIRVPAAYCGVYGHRPSETALARSGHYPGSPLPNWATVMGVQGPLARSAEGLELAFEVTCGPEIGEDVAWRLELPPARRERLAELRVAVLPRLDWMPLDDEIAAAHQRLADGLARAGATVKEALPPEFGDLREHYKVYRALLAVMIAGGMPEDLRTRAADLMRASDDEFDVAQGEGFIASAQQYILWHGRREQFRAAYRAFFHEWDVLLAPITMTPAFQHIDPEVPFDERTLPVNGKQETYRTNVFYPSLTILCGQPATAFPVGLTKDGLPIGLQAIGPDLEDRTPLRFAALLAREFGGFQRPPGYE
jgi:amidase